MNEQPTSRATSTTRATRHQARPPRAARPAQQAPMWRAARAAHQRRHAPEQERTLPLLIPTWLRDQDEQSGCS